MNTYTIRFIGRKIHAIGAFYPYTTTRTAENVDAAIIALYDEYEHIQQPTIISFTEGA